MTDERRYSESEIERIFERALEPGDSGRAAPDRDGLTLPELQDIGREVGIPPARVAEAAAGLDRSGAGLDRSGVALDRPRTGRVAGLPLSVRHTVPLPRQPTEAEWERLVADLRRTFSARGRIDVHGSLRHWSNGNLHAAVEPGEDGPVLRMGTLKGSARQLLFAGSATLLVGVILILVFLTGLAGHAGWVEMGGILAALGIGQFAYAGIPLPRWAAERREQMEEVGDRFVALLADDAGSAGPEG